MGGVEADRLSSQHPAVRAALNGVDPSQLAAVAKRVAGSIADRYGVAAECQAAPDAHALVVALDEAAWDAQDRGDEAAYEIAFRRARAADVWARAAAVADADTAGELLYEAVHALGGDNTAEHAVIRLVRP